MLLARLRWLLLAAAPLIWGTHARGQPEQPYDLVIRGGTIVDGTGNPWFLGDVAIRGDRIAAVGRARPTMSPRGASIDARASSSRRGSSTCIRIPT